MIDPTLEKTVLGLSERERLELIEFLWNSLDLEEIPILKHESVALDMGLANLDSNPHEVALWEDVMAFLKHRAKPSRG